MFRYLCWLVFTITTVLAYEQYSLNNLLLPPKLPYICNNPLPRIGGAPPCCAEHPGCDPTCPGQGGRALCRLPHPNVGKLSGTIDVVLENNTVVKTQADIDLTNQRSYISSLQVNKLGLEGKIAKFSDIDIHDVEILDRNVTVTTFVLLNVRTGIDKKTHSDEIFEIIPDAKSRDGKLATPNLLLGIKFLGDVAALAINENLFTSK